MYRQHANTKLLQILSYSIEDIKLFRFRGQDQRVKQYTMKLHSSQIEKEKMFGIILEHFGPSHRRNQTSVLRCSTNLNSYLNLIHIVHISFFISMQISNRKFKCKISKTMVPNLCTKATLGNSLGLWRYVKISRETQGYSTAVDHTNNQDKGVTS